MKRSIKWFPIVLMMFCVGCINSDSQITKIKSTDADNICAYSVGRLVSIYAPCGWYKIGDKPIRPITDTSKQ